MFSSEFTSGPNPSRLVEELNRKPTPRVREASLTASRRRVALTVTYATLLAVSGGMLVASYLVTWSFTLVALLLIGSAGYLQRKAAHQSALARLLQPLSAQELDALRGLGARSDVVRELIQSAHARRRDLYAVDLVYARRIIVRETRNGALASDRLPLEQTRGLLGPSSYPA